MPPMNLDGRPLGPAWPGSLRGRGGAGLPGWCGCQRSSLPIPTPSGAVQAAIRRTAMAYHLKVLSFAEECALARQSLNSTSRDRYAGDTAPAPLAGG